MKETELERVKEQICQINIMNALLIAALYMLLSVFLVVGLGLCSIPIPIGMIFIIGVGYIGIGCYMIFLIDVEHTRWQIVIRICMFFMICFGGFLYSFHNIIDMEQIQETEIQTGVITKITESEIEWKEGNFTYTKNFCHDEQTDIYVKNNESFQNVVTKMYYCSDSHIHDFGLIKISCSSYCKPVPYSSHRYYMEPDVYEKLNIVHTLYTNND